MSGISSKMSSIEGSLLYLSFFLPAQSPHLLPEAVIPDLRAGPRALADPGVVALVTGGGAGGSPGPGPWQRHLWFAVTL